MIYLVDSAIQRLNNPGLNDNVSTLLSLIADETFYQLNKTETITIVRLFKELTASKSISQGRLITVCLVYHIISKCTSNKSTGFENSLNLRSIISFACTSLRKMRSSLMVFSSSWRTFFSSASVSCLGGGVGAKGKTSKTQFFSDQE